MTKKIVFLVGAVVVVFVAIAVYAATNTGQTLTKDASITKVEVTSTEACSQDSRKDCDGNCENCDGNCQNWDNCDRPCKGHGEGQGREFGKCGGGRMPIIGHLKAENRHI